ncbi:MAG: hypothetical protein ACLFQK_02455 [Fibrobacterota bacterium]
MRNFSIISMLLLSLVFFASAEDSTENFWKHKNNYGFAAGITSGYGLSYRRHITGLSSVQINFFPYFTKEIYDTTETMSDYYYDQRQGWERSGIISLGAMYNRYFDNEGEIAVIGAAGGNIHLELNEEDYKEYIDTYIMDGDTEISKIQTIHRKRKFSKTTFTTGASVGGELRIWRIYVNLLAGARVYYTLETKEYGTTLSVETAGYVGF